MVTVKVTVVKSLSKPLVEKNGVSKFKTILTFFKKNIYIFGATVIVLVVNCFFLST